MSHTTEEKEIKIFSARQALVDLKAKLVLASMTKTDVKLTPLEAKIALSLMDERTPWSL